VTESAVVTILFCDLVGSTAAMTAAGDDAWDTVRREFLRRMRAEAEAQRGVVIKTAGDGVMAVFASSAVQAVTAGVAMQRAVREMEVDPPLQLRVGIATGEAIEEDGDWQGTPVVEAARLCSAANDGDVIVSAVTQRVVGSRGGHTFVDAGALTLKGIPQPVPAARVAYEGATLPPPIAAPEPPRPRRSTRVYATAVLAAGTLVVATVVVLLLRNGSSSDGDAAAGTGSVPSTFDRTPDGYTPAFRPAKCTAAEQSGDPTVTCGYLVVPEDRRAPTGRRVQVRVVRAPAIGDGAGDVPTFLVGAHLSQPASSNLRAAAEQISMQVRGVDSVPSLDCPEVTDRRADRLAEPALEAKRDLNLQYEACAKRLRADGIALDQYGPDAIATDIRDLAIALDVDRVVLRTLGVDVVPVVLAAARYPALVKGVIVTSPIPPGLTTANTLTQRAESALTAASDRCRRDPRCRGVTADFRAAVDATRDRFRRQPADVEVDGPEGRPLRVLVDGDRTMLTLFYGLQDDMVYGLLPAAAASGDPQIIATYAAIAGNDAMLEEGGMRGIVMRCALDYGAVPPAQLQGEYNTLPAWRVLVDLDFAKRCRDLGLDRVPLLASPAGAPAFITTFGLDSISNDTALRVTQRMLPRNQVLMLPNRTSNVGSWPECLDRFRLQFTRRPGARLDVDACAKDDKPIDYSSSATVP
jgi:class 3 adenylate cyclase